MRQRRIWIISHFEACKTMMHLKFNMAYACKKTFNTVQSHLQFADKAWTSLQDSQAGVWWQNPAPAKPLCASCTELFGKDSTASLLLSSALLVRDFDVSFMMLLLYSLGAEKCVISLIVIDTVLQPPCAQTSAQKLHTAPGEYWLQDLWCTNVPCNIYICAVSSTMVQFMR